MTRNISFTLTEQRIRDRTKTVARLKGCKRLKAGDVLSACRRKGFGAGERIERLCRVRVVGVRREPLNALLKLSDMRSRWEVDAEGFPQMTADEFVEMFCEHMGGSPDQEVTRIKFKYIT